jgi:nitric oxide reductase subunit B
MEQLALLVGLPAWVVLLLRALCRRCEPRTNRHDSQLFVLSVVAIAGYYGCGARRGRAHQSRDGEYWRWWVVHLWVEGSSM